MTREGIIVRSVALGVFLALCFLAITLSGCATPAVEYKTVEVKVPVMVQPLKPEQVPAVPAPLGSRPDALPDALDVLLAKHCELVAYVLKADPLLRVSAGVPMADLPVYRECGER